MVGPYPFLNLVDPGNLVILDSEVSPTGHYHIVVDSNGYLFVDVPTSLGALTLDQGGSLNVIGA